MHPLLKDLKSTKGLISTAEVQRRYSKVAGSESWLVSALAAYQITHAMAARLDKIYLMFVRDYGSRVKECKEKIKEYPISAVCLYTKCQRIVDESKRTTFPVKNLMKDLKENKSTLVLNIRRAKCNQDSMLLRIYMTRVLNSLQKMKDTNSLTTRPKKDFAGPTVSEREKVLLLRIANLETEMEATKEIIAAIRKAMERRKPETVAWSQPIPTDRIMQPQSKKSDSSDQVIVSIPRTHDGIQKFRLYGS